MSNGSEESRRVPRIETAHVKVKARGRITKERLYFDVAGVYGSLANHTGRTFAHTAPHALQSSRPGYSSRLNGSAHPTQKTVLIHRRQDAERVGRSVLRL